MLCVYKGVCVCVYICVHCMCVCVLIGVWLCVCACPCMCSRMCMSGGGGGGADACTCHVCVAYKCVTVCVTERERKRESVCVCVCVCALIYVWLRTTKIPFSPLLLHTGAYLVSVIWKVLYPAMYDARRVRDCFPEPPTPTNKACPLGVRMMREMRTRLVMASCQKKINIQRSSESAFKWWTYSHTKQTQFSYWANPIQLLSCELLSNETFLHD